MLARVHTCSSCTDPSALKPLNNMATGWKLAINGHDPTRRVLLVTDPLKSRTLVAASASFIRITVFANSVVGIGVTVTVNTLDATTLPLRVTSYLSVSVLLALPTLAAIAALVISNVTLPAVTPFLAGITGEPAPAVPTIVTLMLSVVYIGVYSTDTVPPFCAFNGARVTEVPVPVAWVNLGTGNSAGSVLTVYSTTGKLIASASTVLRLTAALNSILNFVPWPNPSR